MRNDLKIGVRVKCWGIPGGPFLGKIIAKGTSKDCWICKIRLDTGIAKKELHQDYLIPRRLMIRNQEITFDGKQSF